MRQQQRKPLNGYISQLAMPNAILRAIIIKSKRNTSNYTSMSLFINLIEDFLESESSRGLLLLISQGYD